MLSPTNLGQGQVMYKCVVPCTHYQMGGRLALSIKSWPHNCEAGVRSPLPVVTFNKEPSTQLMRQCCYRPDWPKNSNCALCNYVLYNTVVSCSKPPYARTSKPSNEKNCKRPSIQSQCNKLWLWCWKYKDEYKQSDCIKACTIICC